MHPPCFFAHANDTPPRQLCRREMNVAHFCKRVADGIVNADESTRKVLATHLLSERSYSPSALQHFAACPYRFLLQAIFQFRPREALSRSNKWIL